MSPLLFIITLSWLMEGVDRLAPSIGLQPSTLPVPDVFYADDTILLSLDREDMQGRFSLLEALATQIGLTLNRSKTVILLAKVKGPMTEGNAKWPFSSISRRVDPMLISYEDGEPVRTVEHEIYLGSKLTRSISAKAEIKRRLGLGQKRADDLIRLWRGTGISRKRKIELLESLVGSIILYGLETLNMTPTEHAKLNEKQRRFYRRALNIPPPYIAERLGQPVIYRDELLELPGLRQAKTWAWRVKSARARLLVECIRAKPTEPIRATTFYQDTQDPLPWPSDRIPGANWRRDTWLNTATQILGEVIEEWLATSPAT